MKIQLRDLYDQAREKISVSYDTAEAGSLAFLLLEHFLQANRADIMVNSKLAVADEDLLKFREAVQRVRQGEPAQQVTGSAYFYDRKFIVNKDVLIPRPETEELVALIAERHKTDHHPEILDIGTGTGCIPITLACLLPGSRVSAVDISEEALAIARKNARMHHVSVNFMRLDILKEIPGDCKPEIQETQYEPKETTSKLAYADKPDRGTGQPGSKQNGGNTGYKYDIIVSNPPYIPEQEKALMHRNVLDYEPELALFVSNEDPLIFYRRIAKVARQLLRPGGMLYFELNEHYGKETAELVKRAGFTEVQIVKDMQGKERILWAASRRLLSADAREASFE